MSLKTRNIHNKHINMPDKKTIFNEWLLPLFVTISIIAGAVGVFVYHELQATVKAKRLDVGDIFNVRMKSKNPYSEDFVFGGTITATNGVYIQYVTSNGDTASTNIRDCYLFPRFTEVVVTKKQEKAAE